MWWAAAGNVLWIVLWLSALLLLGKDFSDLLKSILGGLAVALQSAVTAITGSKFNSEEKKQDRLDKHAGELYELYGFPIEEFESLKKERAKKGF